MPCVINCWLKRELNLEILIQKKFKISEIQYLHSTIISVKEQWIDSSWFLAKIVSQKPTKIEVLFNCIINLIVIDVYDKIPIIATIWIGQYISICNLYIRTKLFQYLIICQVHLSRKYTPTVILLINI